MEISPQVVRVFAQSVELAYQFLKSNSITLEEYAEYVYRQGDHATPWEDLDAAGHMEQCSEAEREIGTGLRISDALQIVIQPQTGLQIPMMAVNLNASPEGGDNGM